RVVTQVVNDIADTNRTTGLFPRDSVRQHSALAGRESTIAVSVQPARPFPAFARLIYLPPEGGADAQPDLGISFRACLCPVVVHLAEAFCVMRPGAIFYLAGGLEVHATEGVSVTLPPAVV